MLLLWAYLSEEALYLDMKSYTAAICLRQHLKELDKE